MKLLKIAAALAVMLVMFASCNKAPEGPTGPNAAGGLIMHFQQGLFPSASYAGCMDTVLFDFNPDTNYSSDTGAYIGKQAGDKKRLLIKFDVTDISAAATVVSATLQLGTSNKAGVDPVLSFHKVTKAWVNNQATWNNRQTATAWLTPGGEFDTAPCSNTVTVSAAAADYVWKIDKAAVQSWVSNPSDNLGLMLVLKDESIYDSQAAFYLSGIAPAADGPKLSVIYTLP